MPTPLYDTYETSDLAFSIQYDWNLHQRSHVVDWAFHVRNQPVVRLNMYDYLMDLKHNMEISYIPTIFIFPTWVMTCEESIYNPTKIVNWLYAVYLRTPNQHNLYEHLTWCVDNNIIFNIPLVYRFPQWTLTFGDVYMMERLLTRIDTVEFTEWYDNKYYYSVGNFINAMDSQ